MGTYLVDTLNYSRILNASLVDQSGNDDVDVTNWDPTSAFVLAVAISSSTTKDPVLGTYQIRWRDVTDSGEFADVSSSGEIAYTSNTNLVNDNNVTTQICSTPSGKTFDSTQSFQVEDGLSPSSNVGVNGCVEMWFGLTPAGAQYEHQYEFEIYDPTNSLTIGTALATITIKAQPTGQMVLLWQEHNPI